MATVLKIIYESLAQALIELRSNVLRTVLSLLGVTIGIFCIISVKAAIDSLKVNVTDAISELGSNTIYVSQFPWSEGSEDDYFKYIKRPKPDFDDYQAIKEKTKLAQNVAYTLYTGSSIKYKSNSATGVTLKASTYDFNEIKQLDFAKGRHFSPLEYSSGSNKVILGASSAESLFGKEDPLRKNIKLMGQNYEVIGVLEEQGDSKFNIMPVDNIVWIGLKNDR